MLGGFQEAGIELAMTALALLLFNLNYLPTTFTMCEVIMVSSIKNSKSTWDSSSPSHSQHAYFITKIVLKLPFN